MTSSNDRWWSDETVAVVTGANRGLGLGIVRVLAQNGVTTILTARNVKQGQLAVDQLKAEGLHTVVFHELDVRDLRSAQELAAWIKQEYGGLDILINNAAISSFYYSDKQQGALDVIETNYYGVKKVTNALIPIFKLSTAGGRIVNISSAGGQLQGLKNDELKEALSNENLSECVIDSFIERFLIDMSNDQITSKGWPISFYEGCLISDYCVSKIALNAYTRTLARDLMNREDGHKIHVNLMCPGFVRTDMSHGLGDKNADEGADTAIWLALLPLSKMPSGKFFTDRVEIPF